MNGNLLEAIQSLVKVKKVDADVVFDALEMVLLTAYKKETGSNAKTSIKLNRETGDYQIFVGADLTDKSFWLRGLKSYEEEIDEFAALLGQ